MNNQTINEILNRDLDSCFFSIYFLPGKIFSNKGNDYIKERRFYNIFYCNIKGSRRYINTIFEDDYTKTSDWYNLFSLWKKKGCEVILYAVIPNNSKLKEALSLAFPDIKVFLSCYETINKIANYFSLDYSTSLLIKIKNIYIAKDINDFNIQKQNFLESINGYSFIADLVENDFNTIKNYLDIPFLLRKHVYSFYFMRDYIKKFSGLAHSKPNFSSILEFQELIVPIIQLSEKKMYCSKKEWNDILNIVYNNRKEC